MGLANTTGFGAIGLSFLRLEVVLFATCSRFEYCWLGCLGSGDKGVAKPIAGGVNGFGTIVGSLANGFEAFLETKPDKAGSFNDTLVLCLAVLVAAAATGDLGAIGTSLDREIGRLDPLLGLEIGLTDGCFGDKVGELSLGTVGR